MRERGPQKSLAAERSFPPLPSEAAAAAELAPLAQTLLARAAEVRSDGAMGCWHKQDKFSDAAGRLELAPMLERLPAGIA